MALYNFKCGSCGHEFEAIIYKLDGPYTQCPECGMFDAYRTGVICKTSFRLDGDCWYNEVFKLASISPGFNEFVRDITKLQIK